MQRTYREEMLRVCNDFTASGLADSKFESELISGDESKFWSSLSEAMVYQRLRHAALPLRENVGIGPDFLLMHGSQRVWVEVICPAPSGLPSHWTTVPDLVGGSVPHTEILLRWTSAIKDKTEALVGSFDGKRKGYLAKSVVAKDDIYVIAVNGGRLRHGPFPALHGISQFPYAAEAVFPIGAMQIHISRTTLKSVGQGYELRYSISKHNQSQVSTQAFLDTNSRSVSAVWALDLNGGTVIGNIEQSAVIHNPLADNPLPHKFFQAEEEYWAVRSDSDEYTFCRIPETVA